jgi:dihydrofolate reductase
MEGTGDFGEKMNSMPKYVASRTLTTAAWNSTIIAGDVAAAVRKLKQEDGGDLLIGGSGQLVDFLTWHALIDEYRLMVYPLVLGDGAKRLFPTVKNHSFGLAESFSLPKGVVVLTYRPLPDPA